MEPERSRGLAAAALVALAVLLLLRLHPAAGALGAAVATMLALGRALYPAGLAALPVLFGALPGSGDAPAPASPPAGPVRIEGRVEAVRRDPLAGEMALRVRTAGGPLWLRCDDGLRALPGDALAAIARSSPPAVVGGHGSVRAAAAAIEVTPGPWSLPRGCAALRTALEDRLLALVPGERGALLATLVLGNGTRLPGDLAAAHRATGLSHLLAVSGAHAAMLAWLLGLQPFGGGRRRPVGRAHLLAAMLLLTVYGAVTGLDPPVFRALCSYALVAAGLRLGRRVSVLQALAWPALCSAVVAPDGVLGASFCLSYAAVAGLSLAPPPRDDGRLERWLWTPMRASLWATLTTAPLTLWFFGQVAPWTVLLTPLLAPMVGAMLFLGLGAALLGLAALGAAAWLGPPLDLLAGVYSHAVAAADALPATPIHAAVTPPLPWLLAGTGAGLCAWWRWRGRRGTAALCMLSALPHWAPAPPSPPSLRLFAVGHGQACLCTLPSGRTALIDCGSQQHATLPARKVEAALHRRRIDLLVLTHADRDHTGAVLELLRRVPVRRAVLPEALRGSPVEVALRQHGVDTTLLSPGAAIAPLPALRVAAPVLPPAPDGGPASDNDRSLWVRIELGATSVLLTGDAEEAGVRAALAQGLAPPSDVLVLPHHGRPNAEALRLLDAVAPCCCLCSNLHGDGRSALGELATRLGVPTFATGLSGDLLLRVGAAPQVELELGWPLHEVDR
ncbi:MAG: ComEC/Rec2 family competence protein [Planctomycetota bacterium]